MEIQDFLRQFFMWSTIINVGILLLSFLSITFARDWVYRMHSRWFPITRETFNEAIYSGYGVYKIAIIVFNLVPWIALLIIS